MTARDIVDTFEEMYGATISAAQVSNITEAVMEKGGIHYPWFADLAGMAFFGRMVSCLLPERRNWAARMGANNVRVLGESAERAGINKPRIVMNTRV